MPGGQRFVFVQSPQRTPHTQCIFVQNWFEELKARVPTGR